MKTLANKLFGKMIPASLATSELPRTARAATEDYYQLRALPMEDIWVFRKNLDNSRVVRAVNPNDNLANLKGIGRAFISMMMVIGLLLPSAYHLMAGRRIHQLEESKLKLLTEQKSLETERAYLLSPQVLAKAAEHQHFTTAATEKVIPLNSVNLDSHLAMNFKEQ